jgi:hypothetical protein
MEYEKLKILWQRQREEALIDEDLRQLMLSYEEAKMKNGHSERVVSKRLYVCETSIDPVNLHPKAYEKFNEIAVRDGCKVNIDAYVEDIYDGPTSWLVKMSIEKSDKGIKFATCYPQTKYLPLIFNCRACLWRGVSKCSENSTGEFCFREKYGKMRQ